MPSIISVPTVRRNSRGMTQDEATEYVTLLSQITGKDEGVLVDDSTTDSYEKSYVRGERVRIAVKKYGIDLPAGKAIAVRAYESDTEGEFVAAVMLKDAKVEATPAAPAKDEDKKDEDKKAA